MRSSARRIAVEAGSRLADLLTMGGEAFDRRDANGVDDAYRRAVEHVAGTDRELWLALAIDHVALLIELRQLPLAANRCAGYLDQAGSARPSLLVLRAEIRSAQGNQDGVREDAAELADRRDALTADERARMDRVTALAAAGNGDLDGARRGLDAAERAFRVIGDLAAVRRVRRDRILVGLHLGEQDAVDEVLTDPQLRTVADHLAYALALKDRMRYEQAIQVLLAVAGPGVEPERRAHVLHQLVVLYRITAQPEEADRCLTLLVDAVAVMADQRIGAALVADLSDERVAEPARFDQRIRRVRRLIVGSQLAEAEAELGSARRAVRGDREVGLWRLAAGELELTIGTESSLREAVEHLEIAAADTSPAEVRVDALRALGRACGRLGADAAAAHSWAEAHRLEEHIAGLQLTDRVRIRMLQSVPDEHDERIRAAFSMVDRRGIDGIAAVVVAMEAARGAAILGRILPGDTGSVRDLPRPSDHEGAWRWINQIGERLPRSRVIWIMHSTHDRVHHAILGRGLLQHVSVPCWRPALEAAIDELMSCWANKDTLEDSIESGQFEARLAAVADQAGIGAALAEIPAQVRRIAAVAGGALAEIPLAAVRLPGGQNRVCHRFALSDLPCLSALLPLQRRSRGLRGRYRLRISPPAEGLAPAPGLPARTRLAGTHVTPGAVRAELERHSYRQVRIDAHGRYDHGNTARSWLQFAPAGKAGRLEPRALQDMNLRGCATMILGACESGMAQRVGRDERVGFARAAIHAGAASVVAARWVAEDNVAGAVLDRFEGYARYLPRDVALQRAQRDILRGARGTPTELPHADHPARWACWTLFGDAGRESGAPMIVRLVRRGQQLWRNHVRRR